MFLGRTAVTVADAVRDSIVSGRVTPGQFVMSERQLAETHSIDKKTVRRALKALEAEGLIQAVDRHGYRVTPGASDPGRGCPVAFISTEESDVATWHLPAALLLPALQAAGNQMGWSLLASGSRNRTSLEIIGELRRLRCGGIVLNNDDEGMLEAVRQCGIPAVMVDRWVENAGFDCVMQDGQLGGVLAVRYLLERGCRRLAWFGPKSGSPHNLDRFSGVAGALDERGLSLSPDLNIKADREEDIAGRAGQLLDRADRPDGVVCCWTGTAAALAAAARQRGLKLGEGLHLVGWCPEEAYDSHYRPAFGGGVVPPALVWSVQTMAETAMTRLAERWRLPGLPALRVKVPVRLKGV